MTNKNIGQKHDVIYAEDMDGNFMREEMVLIEVKEYKNSEVYLYRDSDSNIVVSYNHGEKIDWEFMNEINNEFN